MKSSETKTPAVQAKKTAPFFNKGGKSSFLQRKGGEPFFPGSAGSKGVVQAKLTIGAANDVYEKEADHVADHVVQRLADPSISSGQPAVTPLSSAGRVQEKCAHCEQKDKEEQVSGKVHRKPIFESEVEAPDEMVQRKCSQCEQDDVQKKGDGSQDATPQLESRLSASAGTGSPMAEGTRTEMESAFSQDFSHVRIHNTSSDAQLSAGIGAQAFTHGSDIYFNSGKYNTSTTAGKHLLAHELTHVVQQSGKAGAPGVNKKRVQRILDRFYQPTTWTGRQEHKIISGEMTSDEVVTNGPIPNAQRGRFGSVPNIGFGNKGYVDFYWTAKPTTIIGAYFLGHHKPTNLAPLATNLKGKSFTHPKAPLAGKGSEVNTLTDLDKAPNDIRVAELKPAEATQVDYGVKQIEAYAGGVDFAAKEARDLMGPNKWDPKVNKMNKNQIEPIIPDKFRPENKQDPFVKKVTKKTHIEVNGADSIRKTLAPIEGQLMVTAHEKEPGIMTYAWVPTNMDPKHLPPLPPKAKELNEKIDSKVVKPLEEPMPKKNDDTPGKVSKKEIPGGTKSTNGEFSSVRQPVIQRAPEVFNYKTWKDDKKEVEKEYDELRKTADYKKALLTGPRLKANKAIETHMGLKMPHYDPALDAQATEITKFKFWGNRATGILGFLKDKLGWVFDIFIKGYNKLKTWAHNLLRKLNFSSSASGLAGSAFKAVFNIIKVIARVVMSKVVDLFKQDIATAIETKIHKLIEESGVEETIQKVVDKINSYIEPLRVVAEGFKKWLDGVMAEYKKYFDEIAKIVDAINDIKTIVSLVEWGARAIECVSPPIAGCLWMIAQSALEYAAAKVVETCWFRKKIAPLVLKWDIVTNLAKKIHDLIKGLLVKFLPTSLTEFFFPEKEELPPAPTENDVQCGSGGGAGEDGAGEELTPEQEAIMKMQEDLGDEKFAALMELMKKAGVDPNTKLSVERIKELSDALTNLSASDIQKMADAYVKGDTKSVPGSLKDTIKKMATDPKGQKGAEPDLDAGKEAEKVDELEARKDANEAARDQGMPIPSDMDVSDSSEPAKFLLNQLIDGSVPDSEQILQLRKGKLVPNLPRVSRIKSVPRDVDELMITVKIVELTPTVMDVKHDLGEAQQVSLSLKIKVTGSSNASIPEGTEDSYVLNFLWDPGAQKATPLEKPKAIKLILSDIEADRDPRNKEYYFPEIGFNARLDNYSTKENIVVMHFSVTSVQKDGVGIFDFKEKRYISLEKGKTFVYADKLASRKDQAKHVQPKAEPGSTPPKGNIESRLKGGLSGAPLPAKTRAEMEGSLGADLGRVRIHTDNDASELNRDLGAQAFTYGNDIYFNSGKYNTSSTAGKHLLAHELTHVVQQGAAQNIQAPATVQLKPDDNKTGVASQASGSTEIDLGQLQDFNAADWLAKANIPDNTVPPGVMESEDFKLELLKALNPLSTSVIVPLNSVPDKYSGLPEKHMVQVEGDDAASLFLNSAQDDDGSFPSGAGMGAMMGVNKTLGSLGFNAAGPNAIGIIAFPMSKTVRTFVDGGKWSTPGPILPGSKIILGHTALYARVDGKIVVIKSYGPTSLTDAALNMKGVGSGKAGVDASVLDHLSGDAPGGNMFEVNAARSIEYPMPKDVVEQFVKDLPEPGPVPGGQYTARPETANLCNGENCVHWAVDYVEKKLGVPIGKGGISQNDVGGVDTARQGRVMELLQNEHPAPLELPSGESIQPVTGKIPTSLNLVKWGGRICLAINIGSGIYRIATASDEELLRVIGEVGGNFAGGYAGAEAGVGGCVALGIATDGLGLIACGIVGGIFGAEAGEAFGGRVMSLPDGMMMGTEMAIVMIAKMLEVTQDAGKVIKGTLSYLIEEDMRAYQELNYNNWDIRYLSPTLQNDVKTFGQTMWQLINDQKDIPADADQSTKFLSVLQKASLPIGQLGITPDLMMRITKELSDMNIAGGGQAYSVEQFTGLTSLEFVRFLEQTKLQFVQDPLYQANPERFWFDSTPERNKDKLNIQYRPAIEERAKLNVSNWELVGISDMLVHIYTDELAKTPPANDGSPGTENADGPDADEISAWFDFYDDSGKTIEKLLVKLGTLVWNQVSGLNFADFSAYMYTPLSGFNPDQESIDSLVYELNGIFDLLNKGKNNNQVIFMQLSSEYILSQRPSDLVDSLVQYGLLHLKKAPSDLADLAIVWMNAGFEPW